MDLIDFKTKLNNWGQEKVPFLFLIDFEMQQPKAWALEQLSAKELLYSINGISNVSNVDIQKPPILKKQPIAFEEYRKKFELVKQHLTYGNSFLTNLTCKTKVELNLSLEEIFRLSKARYKVCMPEKFVVYSPEIFVKINQAGLITSYPMKGTIDANIPNAKEKILADKKEMAEHITIVDLIRNDLSLVASEVQVPKFRYVEEIQTYDKKLLQISSVVSGKLSDNWRSKLGEIFFALLPAGSVSGAPKPATLQIIKEAEGENRNYYSGIVGLFNGEELDSGVLIRFIEQEGRTYYYRSGGGITTQSDCRTEYNEMIDKIYVPLN
jgi:para-aminobenzoate synthetase component I